MSTNKGAVLVPESQLTEEELEEITGGLLPGFDFGRPPRPGPGLPPIFERPVIGPVAGGCGTDDSGAMGCPG
jgi:bacteriocin-like protein